MIHSHPEHWHTSGVCPQTPPLLPLTHDCSPIHTTNAIVKFADDTTIVGLITNNNESAYRE